MNHLKNGLIDPNAPNYVFLQIKPETVRILNNQGEPPQVLNL
jgi:hypothetical protein